MFLLFHSAQEDFELRLIIELPCNRNNSSSKQNKTDQASLQMYSDGYLNRFGTVESKYAAIAHCSINVSSMTAIDNHFPYQ